MILIHNLFFLPELGGLVVRDFIEISKGHLDGECPRLYLRRERAAKLDLIKVEIANIIASGQFNDKTLPSNLDDNSVWENCTDWWALPDGQLGFVELYFSKVGQVSRIEILNTRYHSTDSVRVSVLLHGQVIHQEEINVNRYPKWTIYHLPQTIQAADAIRIDILKFSGRGAGLNEVKVFKDN